MTENGEGWNSQRENQGASVWEAGGRYWRGLIKCPPQSACVQGCYFILPDLWGFDWRTKMKVLIRWYLQLYHTKLISIPQENCHNHQTPLDGEKFLQHNAFEKTSPSMWVGFPWRALLKSEYPDRDACWEFWITERFLWTKLKCYSKCPQVAQGQPGQARASIRLAHLSTSSKHF